MENKQSPYYKYSVASKKVKKIIQTNSSDPIRVAKLCKTIMKKKSPKFRYLIGKDAFVRAFLKRLLPFEIYKKCVLFAYKKLIING